MTGSIYNWSTTAASNANADGDINFAEGQAPSTLNNSNRQVMGRLAEYLADNGGALVAGGTANAITVTANSAFTAYADGLILALRITTDNTAATTLNVNGLGNKSIRKMLVAGETALSGGELQATGICLFRYSTALNGAAGAWLLLNPASVGAATTTAQGFVQLATDAEAIARSATDKVLTPSNLAAAIGPASSVDNVIARFDGTSGKFQVSGVTIDDSNNIATAGTFTATGAITSSANITANAAFIGPNTGVVLATVGAGTVFLRPNGFASSTGQVSLTSAGAVSMTGPLTVGGSVIPFTKSFESAQQTVTTGGSLTLAHSMGVSPKLIQVSAICQTAERSYSINDEMIINPSMTDPGSNGHGLSVSVDATNVNIRYSVNTPLTGIDKSSGFWGNFTNANWKLVVRAWA